MEYKEVMRILSQCGLGVLAVDQDENVTAANETACRLLHRQDSLEGQPLAALARPFCRDQNKKYAGTAFGEYIRQCPAPEADGLPRTDGWSCSARRPTTCVTRCSCTRSIR